ncbi:b(0,+)-type amino acid transporter 1 isoform X3 [Patella vulgata]|nr:b(0,+)-type amino acid transporter 1 isoform X3 [Patella vulgata]
MEEKKINGVKNGVVIQEEEVTLKKRVGLVSGVALIVGTMIGSGIFISPKGVLQGTGSVGLSMIVWAGCGLISICGALSYAELGTLITKSGAEYSYILEASKCLPRWLAPIPAYLFAWVSVLVLKPSLFAVIALSFGIYTVEPFFKGCDPPEGLVKLVSALCLLLVAFINCYSVNLATKVQNFFTFAKLLAIVVITIGGFVKYAEGNTEYLEDGFEGTAQSASGIALAFYDGLWAYDGWNNLNYVTEELKNPYVNLPRSIIIAIPLVTVCYLLTNISYFSIMSKAELLASDAVAATWGSRVLGVAAIIIPISVACSTFGAANGSCFTGGRLVYAAAREGHLPEILSYVHVTQYTPLPSLLFTSFIALLMIIPGDIFTLIDFFSFTAWLFYGATMLAVIVLRFTKKNEPRPYKVPIFIPVFVLLCSIYLIIGPIVDNPKIEFLYAFLFVISGMIFYVPFVHFKLQLPGMDKFTTFLQLILQVAPSKYAPPE